MKKALILLLFVFYCFNSFSQNDSIKTDNKSKDRYGFWLIPSASKNIYGIAFGLFGSETKCNRHYTKYSHGLNLQIPGQGFLQVFLVNKVKFEKISQTNNNDSITQPDTILLRAVHNGIIISPLGTFTPKVNGLSFSLFMSLGHKINGISINLFWNLYDTMNGLSLGLFNTTGTMKGIQAGLFNKSANLRGIQFGIWNKNEIITHTKLEFQKQKMCCNWQDRWE
jgi:hypothetical protein